MDNRIIEAQLEISKQQKKIRDIAQELYPEYDWMYHIIDNFWECDKSPFGRCCYNELNDKAHDNCVFCHEPEERK